MMDDHSWIISSAIWLGQLLAHATVLAGLTWLLCRTILRNARPSLRAVLWTIVLFKFLIPPVLPGYLSLSHIVQEATALATSLPSDLGLNLAPADSTPGIVPLSASQLPSDETPPAKPGSGAWILLILVSVYGAGLIVQGFQAVTAWRQGRRHLQLLAPAKPEVKTEVRRLSAILGLSGTPEVKQSEERISPFVVGILRPHLVLPSYLFVSLSAEVRAALIVHELAHIRRGDLLVRGIQGIARRLFYFWPPVRWVCREIEKASEMACDHWAIQAAQIPPRLYAESLLNIVRSISATRRPANQLAFALRRSFLEERFNMISRIEPRIERKMTWAAVPAVAVWALFSLTGEGSLQAQEASPPSTSVTIHVKGNPAELKINSGVLPEADADQDGFLNLKELEAFQHSNPGQLELRLEDGPADRTEVQVEVRKTVGEGSSPLHEIDEDTVTYAVKKVVVVTDPEDLKSLLEKHPEADLDGDGELSPAELEELGGPEGENTAVWVTSDGFKGEAQTRIESEVETKDGAEFMVIHVLTDGEADAGASEPGTFTVRHESPDRKVVVVESAGNPETNSVFVLRQDDGSVLKIEGDGVTLEALDGDGNGIVSVEEAKAYAGSTGGEQHPIRVMLIKEVRQVQEAPLPSADLSTEELRAEFLRTHPDADLDHDGVISADEAKAIVAKGQAAQKKQAENPPQD